MIKKIIILNDEIIRNYPPKIYTLLLQNIEECSFLDSAILLFCINLTDLLFLKEIKNASLEMPPPVINTS